MKPKKFKLYVRLALVTFVIYGVLYYVLFAVSGTEEFNAAGMLFRGVILALIVPLFSKKISPFPKNHPDKAAGKNKRRLAIIAGALLIFILIITLGLYFTIKIFY